MDEKKLAQIVLNADQESFEMSCIKLGMCHALSEMGITPKEAEELLQKEAFLGSIGEFLKNYALLSIAGGAAVGVGSAAVRHKLESAIDQTDSPKNKALNEKMVAYQKMIDDLKANQQFREESQTAA